MPFLKSAVVSERALGERMQFFSQTLLPGMLLKAATLPIEILATNHRTIPILIIGKCEEEEEEEGRNGNNSQRSCFVCGSPSRACETRGWGNGMFFSRLNVTRILYTSSSCRSRRKGLLYNNPPHTKCIDRLKKGEVTLRAHCIAGEITEHTSRGLSSHQAPKGGCQNVQHNTLVHTQHEQNNFLSEPSKKEKRYCK